MPKGLFRSVYNAISNLSTPGLMTLTLPIAILLVVSGLIVGFINTLSAGGTAISISLYLTLGLPVDVVNATNRVGVLIQSVSSAITYHSKKVLDYKKALLLAIPTTIGAFGGANMAVQVTESVIRYTLLGVLLMMTVFLFYKPQKLETDNVSHTRGLTAKEIVVYLLIGFYGGFIQVGTGFFLIMAGVSCVGYNLVRTNASKVLIMLIYTVVSIMVFAPKGIIRWDYGLLHGIGCVAGSITGTLLGVKKGSGFVKWVSVGVIALTILILFNIIDLKHLLDFML